MLNCSYTSQLESILDGSTIIESFDVEDHLSTCELCQQALLDQSESAAWKDLLSKGNAADPSDTVAQQDTESDGRAGRPERHRAGTVTLPGYELFEEIGSGGMGRVYRGLHRRLGRQVAVKLLSHGGESDPERWLRFQTEAHAIARLSHPNIIQVYDSGTSDTRAFVSQELADGGTLEHRINHTPQPARESAKVVMDLARAAHHAHSHGVIHRDLKPSNVLFAGGVPKVADFGLAKLVDSDDAITQTEAVMGTPRYMAPEQARGANEEIGPNTDVYALGVILYEMLCGSPPFAASTPVQTLRQVLECEPVSIRHSNPDVPRDLATICHKCLQKHPRKRYRSADQLAADLDRFLHGQPITARATPWWERSLKWASRRPAAAALLAVSLIAVLTLLAGWAVFTNRLAVQYQREQKAHEASLDVLRFLTEDIFDKALPEYGMGRDLTLLDTVMHAANEIDGKFQDEPLNEATVRFTIGNTLERLGRPMEAATHLSKAIELFEGLDDPPVETLLVARFSYANALLNMHRIEEAKVQNDIIMNHDPLPEKLSELAPNQQAQIFEKLGDSERAIEAWTNIRDDCLAMQPPKMRRVLMAEGFLAIATLRMGDEKSAAKMLIKNYEDRVEHFGPDDASTIRSMNNAARGYTLLGQTDESVAMYRNGVAATLKAFGPVHVSTLSAKENLAGAVWRSGQHEEAVAIIKEVIPDYVQTYGAASSDTANLLFQAGNMYLESNRPQAMLDLFNRRLVPVLEEIKPLSEIGGFHVLISRAHLALGNLESSQESLANAERHFKADAATPEYRLARYQTQKQAIESFISKHQSDGRVQKPN